MRYTFGDCFAPDDYIESTQCNVSAVGTECDRQDGGGIFQTQDLFASCDIEDTGSTVGGGGSEITAIVAEYDLIHRTAVSENPNLGGGLYIEQSNSFALTCSGDKMSVK